MNKIEYVEQYVPKRDQERMDKLPQWAQTLIRVMAMRVDEAEKKVDSILAEKPGRVVLLGNRTSTGLRDVERSLGDRATVRFYLKDPKARDTWRHIIECRLRDGALDIHAHNGSLVLSPQSSNVAQARVIDHSALHRFQEVLEKAGE